MKASGHGKPTFSMLLNIEFTDQSEVFKQMSLSIGQTCYVMY